MVVTVITNITLENFKCFRRVSIDPKVITVFIGPNGTGKSGVLQALLLLKQSTTSVNPLQLNGGFIRFPREAFMLHGHESRSDGVRLSLSGYSPIDSEEVQGPLKYEVDLQYSAQVQLNVDRGTTRWETSGKQYEISFDRERRNPQARTPRGLIEYEVSSGLNSFRVRSGMGGENPSLPLWAEISRAPAEVLAYTI